jgi:exodeoxyribonuclease VII large subunit
MDLDVLIVGRGGGSIEDLWAFNEEIVARAIFECETPVISAVGHETDTTIADLVADLRAPTPSAAAELAVFDYKQFEDTLAAYSQRMRRITEQKLSMERMRAEQYRLHLAKLSPENRLRDNRKSLAQFEERLHQRMAAILTDKRHTLALLSGNLEAHSPAKKLSSGYSYVQTKDGRTLTDASDVKTGDEVKIHLYHGRLTAAVTEVFYE